MPDDSIFAIEITSDELTAAFVYPDGTEKGTASFDLADFRAGEARPLDKLIGLLQAKVRMGRENIAGVVLMLSCALDGKRERIVLFPNATWLNDQPLGQMLRDALEVPVVMERRSLALLTCDRAMLGLPENCLAIGCYVETHYDAAIWHNGGVVTGLNGTAGDIAHLAIQGREDTCFCGKAGCVNLYGAGGRLRQIQNMIFPDTPMEQLFVLHGDHPIVLDYLEMMAYPIAMGMNFLDPDYLIVGGKIPQMPGFPREVLYQEIKRHLYRPESDHANRQETILDSTMGMISGVASAAMYARMKLGLL